MSGLLAVALVMALLAWGFFAGAYHYWRGKYERLERDHERLVRACNWLEPWTAAALDSWEGSPMPSENLGKRLYYEFLAALQAVNKERGDEHEYTLEQAREHAWRKDAK